MVDVRLLTGPIKIPRVKYQITYGIVQLQRKIEVSFWAEILGISAVFPDFLDFWIRTLAVVTPKNVPKV